MFQCRQCGRTYEELPASCFCGNANPALWDVQFDAPGRTQPVQQPTDRAPFQAQPVQQPTDRAPFQAQPVQQPMDRAPFQAQPGGYERQAVQYAPQPAAPQPPKKKSNKGLIAVVIVLALLLAGVGGYLAWDHFANNNVSDAEEEDDDDKKSKDNNNKNGGGEETEEPAATEAPATEAPTTEAPTTQAPTTTEPPATQPDGLNGNRYTYRGVSITLPDGFWVQEGSMPIAVPREYPQKTDNIVFAFSGKENIDDYNEQSIYSLAETIPGYQELEGFEKGELDGTPAVMFSIKASMNGIDFEEVWIMLFCPDQTVTLTFSSVTGDYDQAFVDAARSITVN